MPDATVEDLTARLAALEGRQVRGLPISDPPMSERARVKWEADEKKRLARVAAVQAEERRQADERERAEAERQTRWTENRARREAALRRNDLLSLRRAALDAELTAIDDEMANNDVIVKAYAP
jgi:hypothetical protein